MRAGIAAREADAAAHEAKQRAADQLARDAETGERITLRRLEARPHRPCCENCR